MLNNFNLTLLLVVYFSNLFVLFFFFHIFYKKNSFQLGKKKVSLIIKILFFTLAGIPPFSIFFFKLMVLLHLFKYNTFLFIVVFLSLNTIIVYYYYLNFKKYVFTKSKLINIEYNYISEITVRNFFIIFFLFSYFNLFFIFFLDFLLSLF